MDWVVLAVVRHARKQAATLLAPAAHGDDAVSDKLLENALALNIYAARCHPLPADVQSVVDQLLKIAPPEKAVAMAVHPDRLRIENGDKAFCAVVQTLVLDPLLKDTAKP